MRYNLMSLEPLSELDVFQDEMNRLFHDRWRRAPAPQPGEQAIWAPAMDIEETDADVVIKTEIPGMKKEDVKIQVKDDMLIVSGERKHEEETKDKTYHRIERSYGKFQRMVRIPAPVQSAKAKAEYKEGLLTITIPKAEEAKPKEVAIAIG